MANMFQLQLYLSWHSAPKFDCMQAAKLKSEVLEQYAIQVFMCQHSYLGNCRDVDIDVFEFSQGNDVYSCRTEEFNASMV